MGSCTKTTLFELMRDKTTYKNILAVIFKLTSAPDNSKHWPKCSGYGYVQTTKVSFAIGLA
jgi:hypothetical protein